MKCDRWANLFLIILVFAVFMYLNAAGARAPGAHGLGVEAACAPSARDEAASRAYENVSAVEAKVARALAGSVLNVDVGELSGASLSLLDV